MTLRLWKQPLEFDIGHGMNNTKPGVFDPGADPAGKPQEHGDVEAFVNALASKAKALGAIVTISHDKPLGARKAAASADATSFHMNAGGGTGVEVWIPMLAGPKSSARSDKIGHALATAFSLPYRGTKRTAHLSVLNTGFDRLVELDFIDSAKDRLAFTNRHDSAINAFLGCFPDTSPPVAKPKPVVVAPANSPKPVVVKPDLTLAPNRMVWGFSTAYIRLNPSTASRVEEVVHKGDKLVAVPGGTVLWARIDKRGYILRTRLKNI